MVKNTHGGNKHKKFARKGAAPSHNYLRKAEADQYYAVVTKMLGNCRFQCTCIDGTIRVGTIRGKFSGRNKRDNIVKPLTWVLVGIHEWGKENTCDLLEVYTEMEQSRLLDAVEANWTVLRTAAQEISVNHCHTAEDESIVAFVTDEEEERLRHVDMIKQTLSKRAATTIADAAAATAEETEEEINIDDI